MRWLRALIGSALAIGAGAVTMSACGSSRDGFEQPQLPFATDAEAGGACELQCSLDGLSVVDSCTNEVKQTCPADQACGDARCQEPCAAAAAELSSNGCEFYLQPPPFVRREVLPSCYAAYASNTSQAASVIAVDFQGKSLDLSTAVYAMAPGTANLTPHGTTIEPGTSVVVFLSDLPPELRTDTDGKKYAPCPEGVNAATFADGLPATTGIGDSFHFTSSAPVSLSAIFPYGGASAYVTSATLLLPVATWGEQHIIVNAWERITNAQINNTTYWPGAQIVASTDDTDVTIKPTTTIEDGAGVTGTLAQTPATYHLNRGQVLQLVQSEELTGSVVTSTKPTSVFGGHACMFVPSDRFACDAASQELPSFEQWGSEYVGVGYRPRLGDPHEPMPYRIVAARDGTLLDWDPVVPPGAPQTLSAGQVVTFTAGTSDAFAVRTQDADHPIYLAAYMTGGGQVDQDFLGHGDPEFVNVVPAGQYLGRYSFFADPTYPDTSLVVVRAKSFGAFADVELDCAGTLTGWTPVGTEQRYEWTRVDLQIAGQPGPGTCTTGLQHMSSSSPFTATLWGWASWASYAYPGGMAQRKLVATPLDPIR